ncbi:Fc.00g039160.m01.CDS01 [Cosmosporella sp. VM-42]
MESAKQAFNYVAETVQGAASGASKETNKEIAKDSNVNVGTRASAAKDALGDKIDQTTHDNKAEAHKQFAKHN